MNDEHTQALTDLADLVGRVSALVAPAQNLAARAVLAAHTGDRGETLSLADDIEMTLTLADGLTHEATATVSGSDDMNVIADQHALLDLVEIARRAVADAAHTVREAALAATPDATLFAVEATVENLAWQPPVGTDVCPQVRGRALGADGPVGVQLNETHQAMMLRISEGLAEALRVPGADDDDDARVEFTAEGQVVICFDIAADSLQRARQWAGWIICDALAGCMMPLELDELIVQPVADTEPAE